MDTEVQKLECTLHLARHLEKDPDVADPFGFWCAAFFAGIDVAAAPSRQLADVERELAMVRARRQENSPCATQTPNPRSSSPSVVPLKRPRRRPQF